MLLSKVARTQHSIKSVILKREVVIDLFIPNDLLGNEILNLLLLNDGQDATSLDLEQTFTELYDKKRLEPTVLVAIHASENRTQEYGVAGAPDFLNRGASAGLYRDFVFTELLPYIQEQIGMPILGKKGFAGCSLGGISAFDIVWNNAEYFDLAGVFSGAFWWRKKDLKDGYTDEDRIVHQMIREADGIEKLAVDQAPAARIPEASSVAEGNPVSETGGSPKLKFWLMTGTEDETADRNHNLIIDSIDDTIDIIKELLKKGYQRPENITYYEMVGGKHDVETWSKVMPAFLCWAFGRKNAL
ncbi:esterase [Pedobacter sp. PACM 27299]|uniref:alpha/beta hydrolase n=1 Tax=Pedobacter sp. PACM 27299 TaxID=1727164 RepID=UPI000706A7A9|nr:alpha/beta hydrolase-fold protein [Pedobacter sp. PACM 27299]ALL04311.1 esterase [Pedobacter sp. PACM 27299]